jgi:DNA polymerase III alpha subunit
VIKLSKDECHRTVATDAEIAELLYEHPDFDLQAINLADPDKYNSAIAELYLDWPRLNKAESMINDPDLFHAANQKSWRMPVEYQDMDIAGYVLSKCADQNELQRAGAELLEYANRDLLGMLCYLKYLTDTAKTNNIVLGVGRGSSVASFVLYLIGVHRIHSLYHDLDFKEFMR